MVNDGAPLRDDTERHSSSDRLTYGGSTGHDIARSDIWSGPCREAVENLRAELDITLLEGKHVKQKLENIDNIEKEQTQQSAFLRGVKCLRTAKVPLERFKLALDLASPVVSLEPIATAVLGVVRVVAVIATSLANANEEFAKQVGDMLGRMSYIDDCDTLGQKADRQNIAHAAFRSLRHIAFPLHFR
ncbi:uncharacterized protein APUU_70745A [Aspergillus puulaauensis]|uniref:Fungal STAND N-terminal Goodbye domain-containing protein n=1 Tax=Aspergillus puulaauensis TaxID=1220207 RepID=A0A7R7XWW3_9EURO|nr:uncharacterized protein APUU_70745A [Aspergillus puulaauensis]BCS29175.1 hypothetical protein APUU_70745A [Aspergillus puulaauensis]